MQEEKKPLREALNIRLDDTLAKEIDRIAAAKGESSSVAARRLLAFGAEVERRLEAQKLMRNYDDQYPADVAGRIVIQAEFVPYTWKEAADIQEDIAARGEYSRVPTWQDIAP